MPKILFLRAWLGSLLLLFCFVAKAEGLSVSPRIHQGQLDNGLKYQLVDNKTPANAIVMRMRIASGSLLEAENEQGLMHLLEHMAFKGSAAVPEGDMIPRLQRLGLSFGADTNAVTDFEQTVYEFNITQGDEQKLDTGLMLMREIADRLTLDPKALAQEKAVVLAELKEHQSAEFENYRNQLHFWYPSSLLPRRLPIGEADIIKAADVAKLRSLYQRFYTPERTTLILVGDFDIARTEAQIKQLFADWKPHPQAVAPARVKLSPPVVRKQPQADAFFNPRLSTQVSLGVLTPRTPKPDSIELRQQMILESLLGSMLYQRLQSHLFAEEGVSHASVELGTEFGTAVRVELALETQEDNWPQAVALLEQTIRQALQYGFSSDELQQALKSEHKHYQRNLAGSNTIHSFDLAEVLVSLDANDMLMLAPSDQLAIFEALAPQITPALIQQTLAELWQGQPGIYLSAAKGPADVETQLLKAYEQSQLQPVAPYTSTKASEFAYQSFGEPGKIVADNRDPDTGIRQLRFANGTLLNLKPTEFEQSNVAVSLSLGFGDLPFPRQEGLGTLFNSAFLLGGLEQHSWQQLADIFAGQDISANIGVSTEGFGGVTHTNAAELRTQLGLQAAFLTAPGWRQEAITLFRQQVKAESQSRNANPNSAFWDGLSGLLHPGDHRYGYGREEQVLQRDFSEIAKVLASALDKGTLEIALVGDFDEAQGIKAVAETFGAIKRHPAKAPAFERPVFPKVPAQRQIFHRGAENSAALAWLWPTTDMQDVRRHSELMLLEQVMGILLNEEVREKAGAGYSPYTFNHFDWHPTGYGYLGLFTVTDAAKLKAAEQGFAAVEARVKAKGGIDSDLLERARQPLLQWLDSAPASNGFWLDLAATAQSRPGRWLSWQQRRQMLGQLDSEALEAVAREYLENERRLSVTTTYGD
ncbi:M16 family metallopeptidase [Shewanella chilikensis]|uniref:Insulinase family protein n=2 Tax=Shewanella TaxID=22 RepID=A0A6G7LN80_9GAMM|nr:M16 family metallopeptidase [Shewanella chilikensis]QIJ03190.1 insulinase family protein [Shewanella chilikensis]